MNSCRWRKSVVLCLLLALTAGCAGKRAFLAGEDLLTAGQYDEAVTRYAEAVRKNPENHEFRMRYQHAKAKAAWDHLKRARDLMEQEEYRAAAVEFGQAAALDPSIEAANQGLKRVEELLQVGEFIAEGEQFFKERKFGRAKAVLEKALQLQPDNPQAKELLEKVRKQRRTIVDGFELDVKSEQPITLKFKDADVKDVFGILSKLSGINFIFDEDIRAQKVTVLLEEASFAQALELLLKMNNLDKKVLNAKTIILYPKTREKEKQYEDQIIQTFYLSNIDAKKAVNLLRTMLQLRKVYVHEELNALVLRDKPDVVKLAQQIIEAADRADAEVIFDLEVVEVSHDDSWDVGPRLSAYAVSAGLGERPNAGNIVAASLEPGGPTANLVRSFSRLESFYTLPTATFDFAKTLSDSEILANPKIRVKNKEKAKVHVGSREPIITVTINGDNRSDNIQYVDVGVKLDVEPNIQLDDTVVTKLNLEVSNAIQLTRLESGTVPLRITTTNAQTVLTLKDGERTVLGGLIRQDLNKEKKTFPFLGSLPLIGDLISGHSQDKTKREILLSITPFIVKNVDMPRPDIATIWSGGEDDLKAGPSLASFAAFEPESERVPEPVAPALREPAPLPLPAPEPEQEREPMPEQKPEPERPSLIPGEAPPAAPAPSSAPAGVEKEALPPEEAISPEPEAVAPVPAPVPAPAPAEAAAPPPAEGEVVEQVLVPPLQIPEIPRQGRIFFEGPTLANAGEEFVLTAKVAEVGDLYSAPLFVTYDPQLLSFVRAEEGEFLKGTGQSTIFTVSADSQKGQLIIGCKQGVGGQGASGGGDLFRLVFRAHRPGTGPVRFERVNFRNPAGARITVTPIEHMLEVR